MDDDTTPPTDPFALPPTPPDVQPDVQELFIQPERPNRRRNGLLLAVGVAVLVVAAVIVGVLVVRSGDSEAAYSVAAASASAADAQSVAFEQTLTANGMDATSTGRMDVQAKLMAFSMQIPTMSDQPIEAVFDIAEATMYMKSDAFKAAGAPIDTDWVAIDLSVVPGMADVFSSVSDSNPLDVAKQFAAAKSVEEVGMEEVRGIPAKHYLVTVVMADVLAKFPDMADFIDSTGVTMEDEVVYDVWVDESNHIRRSKYTTTVNGKEQSQDIVYTAIGAIEPIVVPSPDEVTDLSQLLGG